jgi:hypothetical protein
MAPLPEGVVASYFTGAKEGGAGIIAILADKGYGYKEPVLNVGF